MTEELSHCLVRPGSVDGRKERLSHLHKAIANSIENDMEEDGISFMQEKYNMYKKGYLKFLRFDPDEETSQNETTFSRLHSNVPKIYAH